MKQFILIGLILLGLDCIGQTSSSGVFFQSGKWTEINKYKDHFEQSTLFISSEKIYVSYGKRKKTLKIDNVYMSSPYLFTYSCTDETGARYQVDYAIQSDKTFHFDW